ncbi:uncharacterized protein LOC108738837 [Agrilus planipennis]|uniref:Uncharacterized protein LOC108738837 n=1 Tax=Agrilus planipennis TaxID=224129 RepID=A0A1W4X6C7_AGRPL|nr:uncharacterized protein LOC108738837 [Agrilus planipennis]
MKFTGVSSITFVFLVSALCIDIVIGKEHHREERAVIVYQRNSVIQFTVGPSFPAQLPRRTISLDIAIQQNLNLPTNYNFTYPPIVSGRAAVNPDLNDVDRVTMYKYLINIIDNVGLNGKICLLKSICEIGQYPMHIEDTDSLLERIVHYVFTPSEDLVDDVNDIMSENFQQDEANGEFFDQPRKM